MAHLEINSDKTKNFDKVKFLKEQENIKPNLTLDKFHLVLDQELPSFSKKSFCDYLVINDFEEL